MKERIKEILKGINEEIVNYRGNDLLGEKIIDSFEVMEIVAALEEEFDIEIDPDHIITENFANMQSIIDMMKKCLEA
ncbi:MAG: acyl carrier protein [Lachnospiraceae bacterium]|nr:acyl carrier protein [Lachnospiraceae bacterium]MDY5521449.1 acyl carrier protein [Agathobacter sp.]